MYTHSRSTRNDCRSEAHYYPEPEAWPPLPPGRAAFWQPLEEGQFDRATTYLRALIDDHGAKSFMHRVCAACASNYGPGDLLAVPAKTADDRRISIEFTVALLQDRGQ